MIIWIETRFFDWIKSIFRREELNKEDTKFGYLSVGIWSFFMAGMSILTKNYLGLAIWLPLLLFGIVGFIVLR